MGKRIIATVVAGIVAGCAHSPAPRYYTLDMNRSEAAAASATRPCNIDVGRLRPGQALARTDILIKKSSTEVEYYVAERWAAGLDELVPQKLEVEFGPDAPGRPTIVVSGTILAFEQVDPSAASKTGQTPGNSGREPPSVHAKLDLAFHPEDASRYDKPLFEKVYDSWLPASSADPGAVVRALSEALEKLAADIAADAAAL